MDGLLDSLHGSGIDEETVRTDELGEIVVELGIQFILPDKSDDLLAHSGHESISAVRNESP